MKIKEKIERPNLSDEVYNILSDRIISTKLQAGARLIEDELAQDLGISRTPIREALNRLAQDGLIELIPRKGAQVSQLKESDVEEIYDVRKVLEGLATEKAASLIEKKDIVQVEELIEKYESSPEKKLEYFLKADIKLHNLIISCCGNRRLIKILRSLHNFVESFRVLDAQYDRRLKQANREHKAIIRALLKKDAATARSLIEQHIENAKKHILSDFKLKNRRT